MGSDTQATGTGTEVTGTVTGTGTASDAEFLPHMNRTDCPGTDEGRELGHSSESSPTDSHRDCDSAATQCEFC